MRCCSPEAGILKVNSFERKHHDLLTSANTTKNIFPLSQPISKAFSLLLDHGLYSRLKDHARPCHSLRSCISVPLASRRILKSVWVSRKKGLEFPSVSRLRRISPILPQLWRHPLLLVLTQAYLIPFYNLSLSGNKKEFRRGFSSFDGANRKTNLTLLSGEPYTNGSAFSSEHSI